MSGWRGVGQRRASFPDQKKDKSLVLQVVNNIRYLDWYAENLYVQGIYASGSNTNESIDIHHAYFVCFVAPSWLENYELHLQVWMSFRVVMDALVRCWDILGPDCLPNT